MFVGPPSRPLPRGPAVPNHTHLTDGRASGRVGTGTHPVPIPLSLFSPSFFLYATPRTLPPAHLWARTGTGGISILSHLVFCDRRNSSRLLHLSLSLSPPPVSFFRLPGFDAAFCLQPVGDLLEVCADRRAVEPIRRAKLLGYGELHSLHGVTPAPPCNLLQHPQGCDGERLRGRGGWGGGG